MAKALKELNMTNAFKRLDYLFEVVKLSEKFNDADFVGDCIEEIKASINAPAEDNAEEGK